MITRFKLTVNVTTDNYGFRLYGYYVGYTEKAVLALAAAFPDNWDYKLIKD